MTDKKPALTEGEVDAVNDALSDAVEESDLEAARAALKAGANPDYCPLNWPLLMTAAGKGKCDMVKLLLEHGADPSAEDETMGQGESALTLAQNEGHHAIAALLVAAGADTSARGDGMVSAYDRAVLNGDYELADRLQRDINDAGDDPLGRTPLMIAVQEGNIDAIKYLLDSAGIESDPDALEEMSDEEILNLAGSPENDENDEVEEEE